jgi:cell division protein FtsQ
LTGTRTRPPRGDHPAGRTIDPRIRARRIEVQRDRGRRRLRRLGQLSALAAALIGVLGLTRTPLLDVDHIDVVGASRTGAAAVIGRSAVQTGDRLTGVPLGRVAARVATLPWVGTVDVRRGWPNRLRITGVERHQVAAVAGRPAAAGHPFWIVLDVGGRQLAQTPDPPQAVPVLQVPAVRVALGTDVDPRFQTMLQVAASVPQSLAGRVLALRVTGPGRVGGTVRLSSGGTAAIELGPADQLDRKWLALASVLAAVDPARPAPLGRIDLRVPSAPALTRRSAHP